MKKKHYYFFLVTFILLSGFVVLCYFQPVYKLHFVIWNGKPALARLGWLDGEFHVFDNDGRIIESRPAIEAIKILKE